MLREVRCFEDSTQLRSSVLATCEGADDSAHRLCAGSSQSGCELFGSVLSCPIRLRAHLAGSHFPSVRWSLTNEQWLERIDSAGVAVPLFIYGITGRAQCSVFLEIAGDESTGCPSVVSNSKSPRARDPFPNKTTPARGSLFSYLILTRTLGRRAKYGDILGSLAQAKGQQFHSIQRPTVGRTRG